MTYGGIVVSLKVPDRAGKADDIVLGFDTPLPSTSPTAMARMRRLSVYPVDRELIPTGEIKSVAATPFDFRKPSRIGACISSDDEQLHRARGYDHSCVLDAADGELVEAAELYEPSSGRVMRVLTPSLVCSFTLVISWMEAIKGKGRTPYQRRSALCLETQHFPDSPNHSNFPSTELRTGERFHSVTVYSFLTR